MIRIGRFELDERDARAREHLVRVGWVPRSRREAWATRVLAAVPALSATPLLRRLGAPADSDEGAPSQAFALAAVRDAMRDDTIDAPLALLPAATSATPRRLLFAWRGDVLVAIAKVAVAGAPGLAHEADAIARVRRDVPAIRALVPEVIAQAPGVLVLSALPGAPLLRLHRLAPPLSWDERTLARVGETLGALHAATRRGESALLHGDAWSRNVLVERDALTGLVDWEAAREGDPAEEIVGFLAASLRADARDRAPVPMREGEWPAGAHALVAAWARAIGDAARLPERVSLLYRAQDIR